VLRLGVPPTLARSLGTTNTIESMISICREHASNITRWQDGQMALRWCAAGMAKAAKQFRRVNGYLHLPALQAALQAEVARTSPSHGRIRRWKRPDDHRGRHRSSHRTRDILGQSYEASWWDGSRRGSSS
jgi:hypothetical protein